MLHQDHSVDIPTLSAAPIPWFSPSRKGWSERCPVLSIWDDGNQDVTAQWPIPFAAVKWRAVPDTQCLLQGQLQTAHRWLHVQIVTPTDSHLVEKKKSTARG